MSTTMPRPTSQVRPHSPVDDDLQALYNQVWAGFSAEDLPVSGDKDIDNIYSVYSSDNGDIVNSPITPTSAVSSSMSPSFRSSGNSATGSVRRLPPTPASSQPSVLVSMPEPDPYHDTNGTAYYPSQSHVNMDAYNYPPSTNPDLLRQVTMGNGPNGRRLPAPPVGAGLSTSRPGSYNYQEPYMNGSSVSLNRGVTGSPYSPYSTPETSIPHQPSYSSPGQLDSHAASDNFGANSNSNGVPTHLPDAYASPGLPSRQSYEHSNGSYTTTDRPISDSGYGASSTIDGHYNNVYEPQTSPYMPDANSEAGPSSQYITTNATSIDRNPSGIYTNQDAYEEAELYNGYTAAGPSSVVRRPSALLRDIANYSHGGDVSPQEGDDDMYWEEDGELAEKFINFSLLSHLAVQLRDKVPRGTHVKGSIPYPSAFTGKDIVSTIQSQIQRELAINHSVSTSDRRAALQVARSLQSQLFFYEVEWGGRVLQDGVEDVYMFLGDSGEGTSSTVDNLGEELPTGVVTMLTRCYVPTCDEDSPCYSFACPRRGNVLLSSFSGTLEPAPPPRTLDWINTVPKDVIDALPESEINRQTIIHKIISKEAQYIQDLDIVESVFIKPLRNANPPIISPLSKLEDFIDDVFGNILDLRECNKRLLEVMNVRQREDQYVIQKLGDVFLSAAVEFRLAYPIYMGHYPLAEKRMKEEIENNPEFRIFLEQCSRQSAARQGDTPKLDLRHYLNRPSEHLQKYPVLLEAIYKETAQGNPDADYLMEAIEAIKNLQTVAQLRTFQTAMGKGAAAKWEWHDLVSTEVRKSMTKEEAKRQAIIFELIKGEMAYVRDIESITTIYIEPLRQADPPILPPDRRESFIREVFHNYKDLGYHHRRLMEKFQEIQREQHPNIRSVTAAMMDAALNFREAYMEYIPNYPIAAYRIDEEMNNNPAFKNFVEECVRHPDAHRLDMKNFINRPIPRLLRYELLLKGILDETPQGHEDRKDIPQVLDVIKALGKDTEPGVVSAKQKVEVWTYNSNLVFKPGEYMDLDLLDEHRSLIHSGKLLRQPDSGLEWNGWSELYVLLFDNYLVMTKCKERDNREGSAKYHVNRRPIPLDLLNLVSFKEAPTQRSTGLLRNLRGERHAADGVLVPVSSTNSPESAQDSRFVFPFTIHHNGRQGGSHLLYAESAQSRSEWEQKLEEALGIRRVVQEANKVFEIETLSSDTFLVASNSPTGPNSPPSWNQDSSFTGKVTCSVPFNTADGRGLVAIGCAEGVWIGFRHDPKSMRRVLHLKLVTQCAMLEEFNLFLVLADKSLFAYHIEALVPSSPGSVHTSQVPQKLNGTKDVHFFSVGQLHGRTLVIYMKKKGLDSIFRVLEPVSDKINERVRAPAGLSRLGFRSAKSEWFRIYRDFFLPSESFDLIFLKAKIAILCTKGFEIMDLHDFKSVTIPQRDDPRLAALAKRCESCRPLGMFRSAEDEFLLVYNEFGLYVDKHGDPNRQAGTIEWEGNAERVALHSPYVLLFCNRFIEIRHVETGRLAQIIPGDDVRCIWDGRGVGSNAGVTPNIDGREDMSQDAQVHAVMNATEPGSRVLSRASAQHVFELLPTVPLYLPEPMAAPESMPYRQSYSPPHSLRESGSWRS